MGSLKFSGCFGGLGIFLWPVLAVLAGLFLARAASKIWGRSKQQRWRHKMGKNKGYFVRKRLGRKEDQGVREV